MSTPLSNQNSRLRALLIKHEGFRKYPYLDSVGKLTGGCGRNLADNGFSDEEIYFMLENDIKRVQQEATDNFAWFKSLSVIRQDAVLNMLFNLGMKRFQGFKKMIAALIAQNYELAADEALNSTWSTQVGLRAREIAEMIRTGRYPFIL